MDSNITRSLELGLGFLLFVIGMTVFFSMNSRVLSFGEEGIKGSEKYSQVQQVKAPVSEKGYSVHDLYMLLTDRSMQPLATVLDGVSYGGTPVKVVIDGTTFSPVNDFSGRKSLVSALSALTSAIYDPSYIIDENQGIVEIHFIGR